MHVDCAPSATELEPGRDPGPIVGANRNFPFRPFAAYQEAMRGLESPEIAVLDVGKVFLESGHEPGTLYWDSVHPTLLGHRILAQALHEVLRQPE